jgi:hypothetical protein
MPAAASTGVAPVLLEIAINGLAAAPFAYYNALYQTPAVVWVSN